MHLAAGAGRHRGPRDGEEARTSRIGKAALAETIARVKGAARFVGKKAGTVLLKLTETREKQSEKFEAKLAGRKGPDKVEVGESVVNDTKEAIGRITDG